MRDLLWIALLTAAAAVGADARAQPLAGSQLPLDKNGCATCHGEKDLWEGDNLRLFIPLDQLTDDVHWKHGVNCSDCHGGDPSTLNFQQAHATEVADAQPPITPFRPLLSQEMRSPDHLQSVIQVCGKCHAQSAETYLKSVHGRGFHEAGLTVAAVCIDCHGSHGIFKLADPRSKLNVAHVGATCSQCHRFIEQRLQQSVHGSDDTPPPKTAGSEPQAIAQRKPTCTDCHQGHDLPLPESGAFRGRMANECGNCHAKLSNSYTQSLHGKLTELGLSAGRQVLRLPRVARYPGRFEPDVATFVSQPVGNLRKVPPPCEPQFLGLRSPCEPAGCQPRCRSDLGQSGTDGDVDCRVRRFRPA